MFEESGTHSFDYPLHEGTSTRVQFHFADSMGMPVAIQTWELAPGGYEGMHVHEAGENALEEFYLVLEGTAKMRVGEQTHELVPGDSILAQVGVPHDVQNIGTEVLRLLVVWGKPGAKDFSAYGSFAASMRTRAQEK